MFTSERPNSDVVPSCGVVVYVVISVSEGAQKTGLNQCEELAQNVVNHGWLSNPALVPESLIHFAIFHSDVMGRRNPEVYRVFFFLLSFSHQVTRKKHGTLYRMIKKVRKLRCCHCVPALVRVQTFQNITLLPLLGSCGQLRRKVVIETRGRGSGFRLWGPRSLQFSGYRRSVPRVNRPEREVKHWPSVEGKNAWNYIFDPPLYGFMSWISLFSSTHCSLLRLIVRSRLDVPTFATRRLHACHHARAPSGGRWNCGREMSGNFA